MPPLACFINKHTLENAFQQMHSWGMRTWGGKMAGKILLIQVEYMNTLITQSTLYYSAVDTIVWDQLMPWLLLLSTEHIFIKALLDAWHSGEKLLRREREGGKERKRRRERERTAWGMLLSLGNSVCIQKTTEDHYSSTAVFFLPLASSLGRSLLLP